MTRSTMVLATSVAAGLVYSLLSTTTPLSAQGQLSIQEVLATAKIAGACGILDSQVQYQKATKLDGGDAFVFRFWSTEATRLGKTLEEYSTQCNQAISAYGRLWGAAGR